jgi:hypothetical protein
VSEAQGSLLRPAARRLAALAGAVPTLLLAILFAVPGRPATDGAAVACLLLAAAALLWNPAPRVAIPAHLHAARVRHGFLTARSADGRVVLLWRNAAGEDGFRRAAVALRWAKAGDEGITPGIFLRNLMGRVLVTPFRNKSPRRP